jgi:DNA-binding transcriptional MerR regulator
MIRHYEKLGLIPAPSRRASGYRVYGEDDVRRLGFIARARGLGFEMAEIAEIMGAWGDSRFGDVATRWKLQIESKAAALDGLRSELDAYTGEPTAS